MAWLPAEAQDLELDHRQETLIDIDECRTSHLITFVRWHSR